MLYRYQRKRILDVTPAIVTLDVISRFVQAKVDLIRHLMGVVKTLFMEPGSPWESGYNESVNGKLRDEVLNGGIFYTLWEAQVIIERWQQEYNTFRPHSSLGYRPPAPEAVLSFSEIDIQNVHGLT